MLYLDMNLYAVTVYFRSYTVCPNRYRTRHFFNNFTTNEDIAAPCHNSWAHYRHIFLNFSHNERTPVQISLQYLHCLVR